MKHKYLILLSFFCIIWVVTGQQFAAPPAAAQSNGDATLHDWCNEVTLAIPQIKLKPCVDAQLKPVAVKSVKGRQIMWREFKPEQKPAARVLVIGGIHGDELTSTSIVFRWMELLQKNGSEATLYHWQVIPVLNPDGLLAKPPRRVNANGVDLNRNFPTLNWLREAPHYWQAKTARDPRRYPGTAPLSEPESRWLHDEITRFKPDVIVAIHAPFGVLDFDGPPTGVEAPARFGRLHLNRIGVYPGSLGNFGGLKEGIPVVTLELPHALKMPTEAELAHVWQDMQKWLRTNLVERRPAPTLDNIETNTPAELSQPAGAAAAGEGCCVCLLPRAVIAHTGNCPAPRNRWHAAVF
jgi:murein peptide amidase A